MNGMITNKINENIKEYMKDFEQLPYGVGVMKNDEYSTIIQANSAYYKLLGYTKEQMWEQHQNRISEILIDNVYNVVEQQPTVKDYDIEFELRIRTANGDVHWIHDFAHYNSDLDVFFITVTNITDKLLITGSHLSYEAFQTKHEVLSYIAKYTYEDIVVTDAETDEVVYMNPSAMKLLNFHNESDWLGKTYVDIIFGCKENVHPDYYKQISEDEFVVREYYNKFHKKYAHVECKIINIPALNRKMRLNIINDITAQKRLEHKIDLQKTLHDCVDVLFTATAKNNVAQEAYHNILRRLKKYYGADRAFFYKFKDVYEVEEFYEVYGNGVKESNRKLPIVVNDGVLEFLQKISDATISEAQAIVNSLNDKNKAVLGKLHYEYDIKTFSCITVNDSNDNMVAFMGVTNPKFNEDDKELMKLLSQFIYMFIEHQHDKKMKEEAIKLEAISKASVVETCKINFQKLMNAKENIVHVLDSICNHYDADFAMILSNVNGDKCSISCVGGHKVPDLTNLQIQANTIMEKWINIFHENPQFVTDSDINAPTEKTRIQKEYGIENFIVSPIQNVEGEIIGLLFVNNYKLLNRDRLMVHVVAKDISDYMDKLGMHQKAQLEPTTQLSNKVTTQKLISKLLKEENKGTLFILDIDNFKTLNDTLGHYMGDQAIIDFAGVLKQLFRPKDIIGRIGGDEFMVFCRDLISEDLIKMKAKQILEKCRLKYEKDGITVGISTSIGICEVDERCKTFQPLYENGDYALYVAKKSGKNQYHIYSEKEYLNDTSVKDDMRFYHTVVKTLKNAVKEHLFEVHYQPIYHISTEKFTQAEALIRIRKKDGTLIYPNDFIQVANSTGLVVEMTYQMLEQVCGDFRKLLDENPNTTLKAVSINVPYVQFTDPNMEEIFMATLNKYNILPKQIKIEVTERIIVSDVDMMTNKMNHMIEKGFEFELDDFGTDYSNLQMSLDLPMGVIKLDRSLLLSAMSSESNQLFFQHLLAGVNSIGRKTILEGVETKEQLKWATECNCEYIQGYYFSKPIDFASFSELLLK